MSGWVFRVSEYGKPYGPSSKIFDQAEVDAFRALVDDGSAEAVRAMAHAMNKGAKSFDKYIEIIGPLGKEGIGYLRDMLTDEEEEDRHDASIALAYIEDREATDVLLEATEIDDDTVREQTMSALCLKDDPRIEDVALRCSRDENEFVRRDAIAYLSRHEKYREVLEGALKDPCDCVRVKAARTLALNGDTEAVKVLSSLAESSNDPQARFDAIEMLAYMEDKDALEALYRYAESDKESYERILARAKLRSLGLL